MEASVASHAKPALIQIKVNAPRQPERNAARRAEPGARGNVRGVAQRGPSTTVMSSPCGMPERRCTIPWASLNRMPGVPWKPSSIINT